MDKRWEDIVSVIEENNKFLVFTHVNMDGDAFGSSMALCCALNSLGKNVYYLVNGEIPNYLKPLCNKDYIISDIPFDDYIAIAVDCSEFSRIEPLDKEFTAASDRICIDHHEPKLKIKFAEHSFIDPSAASASLLIYQLLKELQIEITKEMAEYIYLGLSTDTGSFKFHNADARALRAAAELYDYDVDNVAICNQVYSTKPIAQLKIEAKAIENMELFADGNAVISYVTNEEVCELGGSYALTDTCIDRLREIEGADISCFIKDCGDGTYKASLRSKGKVPILDVAAAFGGGGHKMAAGCTLNFELAECIELLKKEILKTIKSWTE